MTINWSSMRGKENLFQDGTPDYNRAYIRHLALFPSACNNIDHEMVHAESRNSRVGLSGFGRVCFPESKPAPNAPPNVEEGRSRLTGKGFVGTAFNGVEGVKLHMHGMIDAGWIWEVQAESICEGPYRGNCASGADGDRIP